LQIVRRILLVIAIAVLAVVLWQAETADGLLSLWPGDAGTDSSGAGRPAAPRPAAELRIEIVETADESATRHGEILARYGDDPAARDWVAGCLGGAGEGAINDSWEYACWQAWAERADAGQGNN
jgi:hypothetical protein